MDKDGKNRLSWLDKNRYRNLSEVVPLNTPLSLLIEPTNRCNFRCIFCPTGNRKLLRKVSRPIGDMSLKLFKKILNDIKSFPNKIDRISLYKDGEPLLHPDLPEMIKLLKNANVCNEVSVTTNLSILTEDLANMLCKFGLDTIRISIESITNKGYKELTGTNYDYDKIKQNVELLYKVKSKLNQENPLIYTKIVDFNLSSQEKQKFYQDFSEISDEINIVPSMNWDGSHGKDLAFKQNIKSNVGNGNILGQRMVCPRPWYTMAINFNGLISICCIDWSYKTIIGDLNDESLLDIWLGPKMYEFRKMQAEMRRFENIACKNCEYLNDSEKKSDLDEIAKKNIKKLLSKPQI